MLDWTLLRVLIEAEHIVSESVEGPLIPSSAAAITGSILLLTVQITDEELPS